MAPVVQRRRSEASGQRLRDRVQRLGGLQVDHLTGQLYRADVPDGRPVLSDLPGDQATGADWRD